MEEAKLFTEVRKYLPAYLSEASTSELFGELREFPDNIDQRLYGLGGVSLLQGDVIDNLPIPEPLPGKDHKTGKAMVVSNSCDIEVANEGIGPKHVVYCPVVSLDDYENMLRSNHIVEERIVDHISVIKAQRNTNKFFLPGWDGVSESIALLGVLATHRIDIDHRQYFLNNRMLSLSNYGFYLFVLKLSIHFSRLRDGVDRG